MSKDVAFNRLFKDVYICMECGARLKASHTKIKKGKTKCRKCGSKSLRVKSKENRG